MEADAIAQEARFLRLQGLFRAVWDPVEKRLLTILRRAIFIHIFYFTFDDLELRHELSASFGNFLKIMERLTGGDLREQKDRLYICIDEVQKLPGFLEYVKSLYDLHYPLKWILTGASSLELKTQVKESLAGRSVTLTVLPFTEAEIFKGLGLKVPDKGYMRDFIVGGQLPDKKGLRQYQASLMPHKQLIERTFEDILSLDHCPQSA